MYSTPFLIPKASTNDNKHIKNPGKPLYASSTRAALRLINETNMIEPANEIPKAVILPGGMPGSTNLRDDKAVIKLVQDVYEKGGLVAAICAAPIVLNAAGILNGKTITSYPSVKDTFGEDICYTGNSIELDKKEKESAHYAGIFKVVRELLLENHDSVVSLMIELRNRNTDRTD